MNEQNNSHGGLFVSLKAIGYLLMLLGLIILTPLLMLIFWPEEAYQAHCYIIPGVLSTFAGYLIMALTQSQKVTTLKKFEGPRIVLIIWIVAVIVGAVPYLLSAEYTLSQSFFESISGFTTTGFTVTDVDNSTHMLLLYRTIQQLVGGVGLILVLTSVLSKTYGMQMFSAEGHIDRLTPSPLQSARTIILIYSGIIVGGTITYIILGMDWFDAVNFSISAVATGGYAPRAQSIGYYHSIPIDIATMILMLLGATNFNATIFLFRGKIKEFFTHYEVVTSAVLIAIATPIVFTMTLTYYVHPSILHTIDATFFHIISMLTTTGLSTIDNFLPDSHYALPIYFVLMVVGGQSGSTAGGLKTSRFAMAVKGVYWDVRENLIPKRVVMPREITKLGKKEKITVGMQSQNFTYFFLYLAIALIGAAALTLCGYDFKNALLEFTSALGTTGLSFGIIDQSTPAVALWIIDVGMIIARLEIYIFIYAAARTYLDISSSIKNARIRHRENRRIRKEYYDRKEK